MASATARTFLYRASLQVGGRLCDDLGQALNHLSPAQRERFAQRLARPLARLLPQQRRQAQQNFARLLGTQVTDPRTRSLAEASFGSFALVALEFLASRSLLPDEIFATVHPQGEQYLAESLQAGRGVIMALPHLGNWDRAAAFASVYGCPLTIVTEDSWSASLVLEARRAWGHTLVPLSHSVRPLFSALARNEAVVLLSDLPRPGVPVVDVPFLGQDAPFPVGPARLAVRTGAPILVCACTFLGNGHYHVEAQPPLRPQPHLKGEEAARELTARLVQGFERVVRAWPAQWYPFSPIWPAPSPTLTPAQLQP